MQLSFFKKPKKGKNKPNVIDRFEGGHYYLSNFFMEDFRYDGRVWPSVEHAFQALKTDDYTWQEWIRSRPNPDEAKDEGRKCPMRSDWDDIKIETMYQLVRAKFEQSHRLRRKLLKTGEAYLVEGNWWGDTFWGVCKGKGENHLGHILMDVREELRDEELTKPHKKRGKKKKR